MCHCRLLKETNLDCILKVLETWGTLKLKIYLLKDEFQEKEMSCLSNKISLNEVKDIMYRFAQKKYVKHS